MSVLLGCRWSEQGGWQAQKWLGSGAWCLGLCAREANDDAKYLLLSMGHLMLPSDESQPPRSLRPHRSYSRMPQMHSPYRNKKAEHLACPSHCFSEIKQLFTF